MIIIDYALSWQIEIRNIEPSIYLDDQFILDDSGRNLILKNSVTGYTQNYDPHRNMFSYVVSITIFQKELHCDYFHYNYEHDEETQSIFINFYDQYEHFNQIRLDLLLIEYLYNRKTANYE